MKIVDIGFHGCSAPGEEISGDVHVVCDDGDRVLLGLVDGLGHGPHARRAADVVVATLQGADPSLTIDELFRQCHAATRTTRGCAMTLVRIDAGYDELTWAAVGNVGAAVIRGLAQAHTRPLPRGGVVGLRLPPVAVTKVSLCKNDLLVLATDGVDPSWAESPMLRMMATPQGLAELLVGRHRVAADDASMMVVRYLGAEAT